MAPFILVLVLLAPEGFFIYAAPAGDRTECIAERESLRHHLEFGGVPSLNFTVECKESAGYA